LTFFTALDETFNRFGNPIAWAYEIRNSLHATGGCICHFDYVVID
jgi:hypothetical protein